MACSQYMWSLPVKRLQEILLLLQRWVRSALVCLAPSTISSIAAKTNGAVSCWNMVKVLCSTGASPLTTRWNRACKKSVRVTVRLISERAVYCESRCIQLPWWSVKPFNGFRLINTVVCWDWPHWKCSWQPSSCVDGCTHTQREL